MKKALTTLLFMACCSHAQQTPETDLFTMELVQLDSVDQLTVYIRDNKPTTYRYYERLTLPARKRVLQQHQADQKLDLTEMVLEEYRHRPRG